MKKFKLQILLGIIILLTGCDATYNLTITEDSMMESASFLVDDTSENKEIIDQYMAISHMAYYDMDLKKAYNYSKKEISEDEKIGVSVEYGYRGDNLQNSSLLDRCYYKKSIIKNDDYIIISTDGEAMCFYKDEKKILDSLTVNIKTELEVLENNADKVEDGVYTWYITDENYRDKPIYIKMESTMPKTWLSGVVIAALIILGIIVVGFIGAVIYVLIQKRKNNKL